eukprot:674139_1
MFLERIMSTVPSEYATLNSKPKSSKTCRNLFIIMITLVVCVYIMFQLSSKNRIHQAMHQDIDDEDSKVLFTNNPNNYLCDPDFLFDQVNVDTSTYQFACAMINSYEGETSLELACESGFTLSCLVSASYGRTAGSCLELTANPSGCGFSYSECITCQEDSFVCGEDAQYELNECVNSQNGDTMTTTSGCSDCMPVCACGMDAPQFYNVADCFGDTTSTICEGRPGDIDHQNVYLPYNAWVNGCQGQNQCSLQLSNTGDTYSCHNSEFNLDNVFYNAINGEVMDNFDEVVFQGFYQTCAYMDLKVLAVCKAS